MHNNASLILLTTLEDYIKRVAGMKPMKLCLCCKTVTVIVVIERQQNNF